MASVFNLITEDSKMSVFIIDLTSELQTHLYSCLFDMSICISLGHLKFSSFKIKFITFPLSKLILASVLTISENDNYHSYGYIIQKSWSHPLQPIRYSQLQVPWIVSAEQ